MLLDRLVYSKPHLYDARSFKRIMFLNNGSPVYILPTSLKISLDISQEDHKNLRGQTVGVLRSFRGGTLSLEMPSSAFFEENFDSRFETLVDIYALIEEQDKRKMYLDRLTCSLVSFDTECNEPTITSKMDFRIFSIHRTNVTSTTFKIDFVPMYEPNSTYYIKLIDDPTSLSLIYEDSLGRDIPIVLDHITSLKSSTKLRHQQKRMDKYSTWLWIQDGVEPATITVQARLYDTVGHRDGRILKSKGKTILKDNTLRKEEILKNLTILLNIQKKAKGKGAKGKLPPEIYLKSTLLTDIMPYSYNFYLTKLDYELKDNYIDVTLELTEKREENPKIKPYIPKSKRFINKEEDLFTLTSLAKGELDSVAKNRAINAIK